MPLQTETTSAVVQRIPTRDIWRQTPTYRLTPQSLFAVGSGKDLGARGGVHVNGFSDNIVARWRRAGTHLF